LNVDHVIAKGLHRGADIVLQAVYDRKNKDDGKDPNGYTKQTQERAQLIAHKGLPCKQNTFFKQKKDHTWICC
jgi:hypothetical protein